jgi:hypothetical protein
MGQLKDVPRDRNAIAGFYGTKTVEHYKNKPGLWSEKRERQATTAQLGTLSPESELKSAVVKTKTSMLKKVFSRRKTVAS